MSVENERIIAILQAFDAFCNKMEQALKELRRDLARANMAAIEKGHNLADGVDTSDIYDPPLG